jgi:hypothetical protein
MLEKSLITLALSQKAYEQVQEEFGKGRWISWDFPDYTIKLELDPTIENYGVIHRHDGRRLESQRIMSFTFPNGFLPDDITHLVNLSYSEAVRCYESSCFLASIALCGRTIETVLGSLYEKTVGVHPSKESTKPGMNAIINRLTREGFVFPAGLKEKMEVIALHRNMAIHGNLILPNEDEVRSVIYSTRDVLKLSSQPKEQ